MNPRSLPNPLATVGRGRLRRGTLLLVALLLTASFLSAPDSSAAEAESDERVAAAEIGTPVLISPPSGARTTGLNSPPLGVPTLKWATVTGATRYHIQISLSAGFATSLVDKITYTTSYVPEIALSDGIYYWRVKAAQGLSWGAYSDYRVFEKDWSADGTNVVRLTSPPQEAERAAYTAEDFSWTPVAGAARYLFEISTDPHFTSIIYKKETVKNRHTPDRRPANNVYYWRVTPMDRQKNYGTPSAVGTFTFRWNMAPQLLSPAALDALYFLPRFSWTAVEAAKEYRLEISTQPDLGSATAYVTRNTDYTPLNALSNDQDYYWRVQATDFEGRNSPWSEVRSFRIKWNIAPTLLTPANNSIRLSYPFFSWTPVAGAERYQIQIDETNSFELPLIADEKIYNVTTYAHPNWQTLQIDRDYYWRVRAIDTQGNLSPWSTVRSFRTFTTTSPNPIYPPYYYQPDKARLPVHSDRTIAWPLFVWDTAHTVIDMSSGLTARPDYYQLTVDDNPAFLSPNFQIQTAGLAAAPTADHPFTGLQDGQLYYWRLRAYRNGAPMGADVTWITRYDSAVPQLAFSSELTLIYPDAGFEAVGDAPVLGWLPVPDAGAYRVQLSLDREFTSIVDEAVAQFVNYVPWQGRHQSIPFGTYWWRVRAENVGQAATVGAWSEVRHFNVSVDMVTGNPYDFVPPPNILSSPLTYVATSPDQGLGAYELGAVHAMLDRTYTGNYNWVIAFESAATAADSLWYGIYFDTDHLSGSGAPTDPMGKPIAVDPLYLPDYVLYIQRQTDNVIHAAQALFFIWDGTTWGPAQSLESIGGYISYHETLGGIQLLLPYTAIGSADPDSVGSVAFTVFSTSNDEFAGIVDSIPVQGSLLDHPAFVSDMLMPLYPFDTPLSNPIVHKDMPPLRWRMPYFDSTDGYQVQVARDAHFTDLVHTWETYESSTGWYFALMPTTFQSKEAFADNESYYWRVRIRHERYLSAIQFYDYGPWSPAMRFKLDSREVGNPTLSAGELTQMTPTFTWDRVEGAAGYTIQIDDDANFSSPLIREDLDGTSYTPPENVSTKALLNGTTYYWRVAMRRSKKVIGRWTPISSFTKSSLSPTPISPVADELITTQPTFVWSAVLTPTLQPRVAAPRYTLQVAKDPNFSSPDTYNTDATSFTPLKNRSLADGTWYWRVAVYDANNKLGPYSPVQRFYKEYTPPRLLSPAQNSATTELPVFTWEPVDGAAYYKIQIADNELFNSVFSVNTDNTRYAPTRELKYGEYFWRVQVYDDDNRPGPFELGRVSLRSSTQTLFLPLIAR